jgi:hypothetical protein
VHCFDSDAGLSLTGSGAKKELSADSEISQSNRTKRRYMRPPQMKLFYVSSLSALIFFCGCNRSEHLTGQTFYTRISIDTTSLLVSFHDPIPAIPEPQADFYWPFYRHDDHCSLDHFDTRTRATPRIRYNAFDLDPQHRVTSRTKHQVVLTGDFGKFYSETRYSYAPFYTSTNTSFRVYAYGNSLESEPPQLLDAPIPHDAHLSVVSVIRVFKTPTGYSLISACYAPDGLLLSVSENRSVGGDCREGGSTVFGLDHARADRFGLPPRFPIATYSSGSRDFFTPTKLTSDLDCVNFHYNRNRLVRQDILRNGQPVQTRTLTYKVTSEDTILDPIDETHTFALKP